VVAAADWSVCVTGFEVAAFVAWVTGAVADAAVRATVVTAEGAAFAVCVTGAAADCTGFTTVAGAGLDCGREAGAELVGADCGGDGLEAAGTGALCAGVAVVFWTVCVTGAAAACTVVAGCGVDTGTTLGPDAWVGVAAIGADVPGRPARATPASAAKQATTPATRIDRITIRALEDTVSLFQVLRTSLANRGLVARKRVEFARR
jgi:hypothetical protein